MDAVQTTLGALVAGLVTSVHCVGMCGPIACGLASMPATEAERIAAMTAYHGSRLTGYAIIGAICGALGQQPLQWFFDSPVVMLPWALVAVMLIFGLGLEKKLPRPPVLMKWTARMRFRFGRLSPVRGGLALGLMTPFLPCGPLYLLFGAALLSGSAVRGAEFSLAFGLGTVPLLWLSQRQLGKFRAKMGAVAVGRIKRSLALLAAFVIAFRLWGTVPLTSSHEKESNELPGCCH